MSLREPLSVSFHLLGMAALAVIVAVPVALAFGHHALVEPWPWILYFAVAAPWLLYVVVRAAVEHALRAERERHRIAP